MLLICCIAATASLTIGFMVISVFFLPLNAYRLPGNFFIVLLPFEGYSFNWFLNYIYHTLLSVAVVIFFATYNPVTMLLVYHACWKTEALIANVEELDKISGEVQTSEIREMIDENVQKLVDSCCDINEWITEAQEILRIHFLIEFSLISSILGLCLFAISVDTSVSTEVYVVAIVPVIQLYTYCWLGNRLIVCNEKLVATVYNVKWYIQRNIQRGQHENVSGGENSIILIINS